MKTKQAFNPYLPSWEYVPDAEPHVVGDRVYIYGSHDLLNGINFCLGDYVCWSAPTDDLGNWTYHGVIFKREQDPAAPRIRTAKRENRSMSLISARTAWSGSSILTSQRRKRTG